MESIAIIGLSCRFPGAQDPEAFWRLLHNGIDAITEVPESRWDIDLLYDPNPDAPGKVSTRWGGFLDQIDQFEPSFFSIAPKEAERMDPQHRLTLEVAWEALENAGIAPDQISGGSAGVFLGISSYDYSRLVAQEFEQISPYNGIGNAHSIVANRLSYLLNLKGPSVAVDTACSSSLTAVHLACQSLNLGETDLCFVGGVNIIASPRLTIALSKARMMSPDGRCKTFDASADGYVRGEGCGIILLKRLADAQRSGDRILAVIRGSAVNQDGLSNGLTAPNGPSQQSVIRQALSNARVAPEQISYVEAHGTGTALGDPIEVKSLKTVLMKTRSASQPCWLGSVKTNIGHLEAAAGIAGLIKVVLQFQHQSIVPHLHLKQLNPYIKINDVDLRISTQLQPWPEQSGSRLAGVSSFGFGGTNVHIVLEEAPAPSPVSASTERPIHLLTLSACSEAALEQLTQRYSTFGAQERQKPLADICFTANTGRTHFDHRLAVITDSIQDLQAQLDALLETSATDRIGAKTQSKRHQKIAFLFTGQGSQYVEMGRQLYESQPTFRKALEQCAEILNSYLDKPLLQVLYPREGEDSLLNQTAYTQPALFALEYALYQLWRSWGIRPAAVMGHSVGEYVAACVAGVFSLEDGLKLIAERGRLMQALPEGGVMASLLAPEEQVREAIAAYGQQVAIAGINGPQSTVISGGRAAVQAVCKQLETAGVKVKPLQVSHAFHSPLMEPMLAEFEQAARRATYSAPQLKLISNVTGQVASDEAATPEYWCQHILSPVNFVAGMETLHQQGCEVFLECGPKPILLGMGRQCLPEDVGVWLPSLRPGQEDWRQMLTSLSELYVRGAKVDWAGFDQDYPHRCKVSLPTYPFQRQRYWVEVPESGEKPNQTQSLPPASSSEVMELLSQGDVSQLAQLLNDDGDTTIDIETLQRLVRTHQHQQLCRSVQDLIYEVRWVVNDLPSLDKNPSAKHWLIFANSGELGATVAEELQQLGHTCSLATFGDTLPKGELEPIYTLQPDSPANFEPLWAQLRQATALPVSGVIWLWSVDEETSPSPITSYLASAVNSHCERLLFLMQSLVQQPELSRTKLWVATENGTALGPDLPALVQGPVWGLSRIFGLEHPQQWGGLVDLDRRTPVDEQAKALARELSANQTEEQVAYHGSNRYVARLVSSPLQPNPPLPIHPEGSYLISGGLGGLGLGVAQWLVAQGARHLALLSRNGANTPEKQAAVAELEKFGAQVLTPVADVSNEAALQAAIEGLPEQFPAVRGVIHAAGVEGGLHPIAKLEPATLAQTLQPKVAGTWNLHQLSLGWKLDFFVNFSSIAAVWGSAQQAHYGAANAFQNIFAQYRRAQGLPVLTINWSAIEGTGMLSRAEEPLVQRLSQIGVKSLSVSQMTTVMEQLLGGEGAQRVAASVDWGRFDSYYQIGRSRRLFAQLVEQDQAEPEASPSETAPGTSSTQMNSESIFAQLLSATSEGKAEILTTYLQCSIAKVLGLKANQLPAIEEDLLGLGMDSLMMMQVINQLKQDLRLALYPREFYERPRIDELAGYLAAEFTQAHGQSAPEPTPTLSNERGILPKLTASSQQTPPRRADQPPLPGMAFILSSPRAGSTLLRVMLAGHPALFSPPELHLLPFDSMAERAKQLVGSYLGEGLQKALMELINLDASNSAAFMKEMESQDLSVYEMYALLQERAGNRLLVDKSPSYALSLETLQRAEELFKGAKYIHLIRHPYAVIESFAQLRMDKLWEIGGGDPYRLAEQIWSRSNQNILEFSTQIESERFHLVHYEDLVRRPEEALKRLCKFLEIEFTPALLQPYEGERMVGGVHAASLPIGDPNFFRHSRIEASLADTWKQIQLPHLLEPETRQLAGRLNYSLPYEAEEQAYKWITSESLAAADGSGLNETAHRNGKGHIAPPIEAVERDGALPLSFAQERLWFLAELEGNSTTYNISKALRIDGALDVNALRQVLDELGRRHEGLRTTFPTVNGTPVQQIDPALRIPLEVIEASSLETPLSDWLTEVTQQSFDLAAGPLTRLKLVRLSETEVVLSVTMHHIISDGWSLGVFIRELAALYGAYRQGEPSPLPALPIQYADYTLWQRQWLQGEALDAQLRHWRQHLADAPALLELPTDHPRPAVQSFRGRTYTVKLPQALSEQVKALAQRQGVSLFMTLLTAFQVLLYRYSGQRDIVVGTPIANRQRAELEGLIGFFANTLVLRLEIDDSDTVAELLQKVRHIALEAYAHQDAPFGQIVKTLHPERSLAHSPLFQVMFALQNAPMAPLELPDVTLTRLADETVTAKFDVTLSIEQTQQGLVTNWEYSSDLFEADTIARMAQHFETLLSSMAADVLQPAARLPLLNDTERRRILAEWNDTAADYPQNRCIHELFEEQVLRTPEAIAAVFEGEQLSYQALNARANQLANYLQGLGVGPEALVGLCVERSIEMIVGVLGILKAGGAYVPLDPSYPQERLEFMLSDAQVSVLLTQEALLAVLPESETPVACLDRDWPAIAQTPAENLQSPVTADNLAYVIYTSGSTGRPKGVLIAHDGLCNLAFAQKELFEVGADSRILQFASLNFDASVSEIFMTLASGATLVLAPLTAIMPGDDLKRTLIASAISHVTLPPSALAVMNAEDVMEAEELSALEHLIVAGEACSVELAHRWATICHFWNAYGPTEATVCATATQVAPNADRISIGRPIANAQIYILDSHLQPVPIGVPGELYIGGAGIARGYLNRPELTEEKFILNPFGEGCLYKTGDLARYLSDGDIDFLGRFDHQVKIRGFRIELGEIEAVLSRHEQVQQGVVIAREDIPGDKRLVAYAVGDNELDINALKVYLKRQLPDYMTPSVVVPLEALPLTPSGKVDRKALPAPSEDLSRTCEFVTPQTERQALIASLFAEVLCLPTEKISIYDSFFELGGHSLLATQLVTRLRHAFEVELPLRILFEASTVAALDKAIEPVCQASHTTLVGAIKPVSRAVELSLSFAQERLWFLEQLKEGGAIYNMPGAIKLSGILNVAVLETALQEILRRHEVLRTSFQTVNGLPVQVISPTVALTLPLVDLQTLSETEQAAAVQRLAREDAQEPFDLSQIPLVRASLLQLGETSHVLLFNMHHIVSDGWSMGILTRELSALYQAFSAGKPSPLPDIPIQYADFAYWQRDYLTEEVLEGQLAYWKEQLIGAPPLLELPTDRPRPPLQTFRGRNMPIEIDAALTEKLKILSKQSEATLFMILLAAFSIFLFRYSGQEDIVVGTPIANRNRGEIESLIGLFVNTLALRTKLQGNPRFEEVLKQVRQVALDAYDHQDVPYEQVVEALRPERNLSHSPLFQVMFVLQNTPMEQLELPGLSLTSLERESSIAKFDLTLSLEETEGGLKGSWLYNSDLFDATTIERMSRHFQTLLQGIEANPQAHIAHLPLLTELEQQQLSVEWNGAQVEYPKGKCIHQLFEEQAERTPNAIAVVFEGRQLTYRELNHRANQLACYLQSLEVGPEVLVGVCVERSLEMIVGLLGILKAGGAYVPLDPVYPKERISLMLSDSQISVVLTQQSLIEKLPEHQARPICLDRDWNLISQSPVDNLNTGVTPQNLIYVIYTSGSTGIPKGVLIRHANVVRLLRATQAWFNFTSKDVWTLFHSYAFDFSVWELWGALCYGGKLVVVPYLVSRSPDSFYQLLSQEQVTVLNQTPSAFRQLIQAEESANNPGKLALRLVIFGGEALELQSLKPWFDRHGDRMPQLVNMYGITETTVHVTYRPLTQRDLQGKGSLIGCPIPDLQVYLLDQHRQLVPIGVVGEMYVGGAGVARGYLNRPELTEERFIPNPFSDAPNSRLYKTGDLARFLPKGDLEYLGRIDHQVKIRGFRIELGEIEAALTQHPEVRETVVIAREDQPGNKRLAAYLVPNQQPPTNGELYYFLKGRLPDYMIPAAFMLLDALPLTPNGKVDHRALPIPEGLRPELGAIYMAPRTETEKRIAAVWQQVLQIDELGIHDNFFELGGNSILLIQIHSKLKEIFQQDLSIVDMFQYPTIQALADYLSLVKPGKPSVFENGHKRVEIRKTRQAVRRQQRESRQMHRVKPEHC